MFTGIITATTKVAFTKQLKTGLEVGFETPKGWDDLVLGESIAVNGACLTVAKLTEREWSTVLMPETLAKTSFGSNIPDRVNVELALAIGDRLSGHIVQGHVDGVGTVAKVDKTDGYRLEVAFPAAYQDLVIDKGSITIDGTSLTVVSCHDAMLSVALIPHTLAVTTLGDLKVGDAVNLEFDMFGKYVAKFLQKTRS